jgi:peptidyl-prolyl cis-trans isomerase A (cyclophilin A)
MEVEICDCTVASPEAEPTMPRPTHPVIAIMCALAALAACGGADDIADLTLLANPDAEAFQVQAPDAYRVVFETTNGPVVIEVERAWAPHGADRFYALVQNRYYDDVAFFRVIEGFMAQFGIHGEPRVAVAWATENIPDDPVVLSNERGTLSFAMRGPDTRTTQAFVNFGDNSALDSQGFAPFGRVVEGMEAVDQIYAGYGEMAPQGGGPAPRYILQQGNDWLHREYPRLDYIRTARIGQP